ncbi:MAG: efflux RND transporter periplasmic adaptor subunit [Dysgonamonadaceae bacterium]|jgi:RND family efflux transporter MFP subunit|nr:efflux RND transporter periplasmic adaptor subunit [Dysgonamonadaceae bacterium]
MKTKKLFKLLPFLSLGFLISCGEKKQETVQEDTKVKVSTTIAKLQAVDNISIYTANVQADVINQITPAIPGRIEKIYVEIGDKVSVGQLLVQMESSNLQQQNAQLANLERDYARYSELLKVGGIAQQQVDQMKTQIDILKAAIKNIQDNTQLRSPINGVVTARNYDNGNVFAQLPILTVQQLNSLKAIINVSEADFSKVKIGMPANIKLDVYDNETFAGKVSLIYPTIDAATHTFGVEVAINNRNAKVRPGMYARIELNFGIGQSIVVPDMAVQKQTGSNDKYIYTVENGRAKYHKVELGRRLNADYEILSGINQGDEVIIAGQSRLIDGTPVEK